MFVPSKRAIPVDFFVTDEVVELGVVGHYFVIRGLTLETDRETFDEWLDDWRK